MRQSVHIFRRIVGAALALLVVLLLPTGWLYDLWAGTGTEQGQRPGADDQLIQRQEEIETCFLNSVPATVDGGELVACPLARLRDVGQEETHSHHNGGAKLSVYVSEYITADYPLPSWEYALQRIAAGGFYNRYYLMELGDNSWLCVYFDDYLTLTGTDTYPTGYVRYTTTEERRMLNRMAEDYDVDSVYVLDMYRHGKVNWMLDVLLRLAMCMATAVIVLGIKREQQIRSSGGNSMDKEKDCIEDDVVLKKEDVRRLYHAFLSLCDYVEENIYCANCPLYEILCGNKDETNVKMFSESLKNIRDKCEIKKPGQL